MDYHTFDIYESGFRSCMCLTNKWGFMSVLFLLSSSYNFSLTIDIQSYYRIWRAKIINPFALQFFSLFQSFVVIHIDVDGYNLALSPAFTTLPMAALVWVVFSVIELVLFILVFRKAKYNCFQRGRSYFKAGNKTQDIMTVIARDSTSYFAM